jgi:ABC-type nitrate/sulfonate/bicarbonate transport system substrate-binding protein
MNHSLSRRSFLGAAGVGIAGAGGLLTAGCSDDGGGGGDSVKIVNASAIGAFTLNHLMDQLGYFKSFGVEAKVANLASGNQVLAAVGSGSADLTVLSGFTGVFPAIEKGMRLKVLGGTAVVSQNVLFSKNPQVESARDLAGKTLGVGAVGSELYNLSAALLRKYHIATKDVTFRNVGSSADSLKAALAGQIDCGYGQVGNEALAKTKGARSIATISEELPLWINGGAVASEKAVKSKRKALVKVLAAYAKLFAYLTTAESKDKYVAAYVAAGGSQAEALLQWQFIKKNTVYSPTLDLPAERTTFIQQQNVYSGSQKKVLDYNAYTDLGLRTDALALVKGQ